MSIVVLVLAVSIGVVLAGKHQQPNGTFQRAISTPAATSAATSTTNAPTATGFPAATSVPVIQPTDTSVPPTATAIPPSPTPLPSINFANGFISSQMTLNGTATITGGHLRLTNSVTSQHASAYDKTQVNVQSFTTTFTYQAVSAKADGATFVLQDEGVDALGGAGGQLGYGGIGNSVAVKFDLYATHANTTGLLVDGKFPPTEQIQLLHVSLTSGDPIAVTIHYDGSVLSVRLKDTKTGATDSQNYVINIPATIGGDLAYAGFTGATGAATSTQYILNWTYHS